LFVSFLSPHYPLTCPEEFYRLYSPERVPMPVQWRAAEWPRHPALDLFRRIRAHDRPFDEAVLRRAIATYYGMVTFIDDLIGGVLRALDESGQRERTRVLYMTDHGEHLGDHGLWWKRAMYESAAAVPLILSGPGVAVGRTVHSNVSLIDLFPTVLECVGARSTDADRDLPGRPLFATTAAPEAERTIFSEYHGAGSAAGSYMLRSARYKYVHYCDGPPQLFNLAADPHETRDLAGDPAYDDVITAHQRKLYAFCDPDELDREAKREQQRIIELVGGEDAILRQEIVTYSPPPPA